MGVEVGVTENGTASGTDGGERVVHGIGLGESLGSSVRVGWVVLVGRSRVVEGCSPHRWDLWVLSGCQT